MGCEANYSPPGSAASSHEKMSPRHEDLPMSNSRLGGKPAQKPMSPEAMAALKKEVQEAQLASKKSKKEDGMGTKTDQRTLVRAKSSTELELPKSAYPQIAARRLIDSLATAASPADTVPKKAKGKAKAKAKGKAVAKRAAKKTIEKKKKKASVLCTCL